MIIYEFNDFIDIYGSYKKIKAPFSDYYNNDI